MKKGVRTGTYESRQDNIRSLSLPSIEVFKNLYTDHLYRVDFEIPEFSAVCPKTNLPDYGTIFISYRPHQYCIELKSLKEYFFAYRDLGIFQENVANRVRVDLVKACQPRWLRVHVDYNIRGGIKTHVTSIHNTNQKSQAVF